MLIEGEYVTDSEIPPSDHELKKTIYTSVTCHFNIKNDVPCLLAFTVTSFKVSELKPGVYIKQDPYLYWSWRAISRRRRWRMGENLVIS